MSAHKVNNLSIKFCLDRAALSNAKPKDTQYTQYLVNDHSRYMCWLNYEHKFVGYSQDMLSALYIYNMHFQYIHATVTHLIYVRATITMLVGMCEHEIK